MPQFRPTFLSGILLITFTTLSAQSIQSTAWKGFYQPLADTLTLYLLTDSSSLISTTGTPLLLSTFKLSGDKITFRDYGGINGCPHDLTGSYRISQTADTLTLTMAEDPCAGRGDFFLIKKWIRFTPKRGK
ncbi:MAG TPA: hypothetical protein VL727_21090 [Puia sp.]|nr:hypothetical protein [Puia sp.]